jgi:alpha(1,3/1,4) fucosyltransferase
MRLKHQTELLSRRKMRIGITVHFQFSFFSAGSPQTALGIAESLRMKGHDITFINVSDKEEPWWDDVKGLAESWPVVQVKAAEGFDFCIEVGQHMLTPAQRHATAKKCVWLCRKPLLYHDMEASLFPFEKPERNLEGVSEVWLVKEHTTKDDVQYAELLFRKPTRLMPLTWTPSAVEFHRQEMKAPVWPQVAGLEELKGKPWSVHICETNMSSASSCTVPLFIMREVKKSTQIPLDSTVKIHNADNVKQSEFFRFNVLSHVFSDIQDMSGAFIGRQRTVDFVYDPKSILIAHSRFVKLRYYLLDALWVGVPLIHNSLVLKEIYPVGYYPDNELTKGSEAFTRVVQTPPTIESVIEVRKAIIEAFSPLNPAIQDAWNSALDDTPTATPTPTPTPTASTLRIGFSDMWDDFNPEYNMFTLMLEEAGKALGRGVSGFKVVSGTESMDLLLFGPFGETWKQVPGSVPKVHYTGENTEPIRREDIKLNMGFRHVDFNDGWYLRLPLWMLEINWFQADVERIGNPKPLPIDRCCKVVPEEISRKQKFCSFVVTNPCQPMRNSAFQWLNNYKHVDSAGRLFNNMGDAIFAGRGGGGGELAKHEFLKDYKFCLAYENASAPGYTTEKYLHAKAAGCIPIYWGDPKAERDFNMAGCIDARDVTTSGELVRLVKEVDTNPMLWLQKYSVPALDEVQRDLVRRTLAEAARRMWSFVVGEEAAAGLPKMIGAVEDGPVTEKVVKDEKIVKEFPTKSWEEGLFVTAANTKFLAALQHWIRVLHQHKQAMPNLSLMVYLMEDVSKETEQQFIEQFPEVEFRRFPTEAPEDFKDLWAPQHFAWKLWILKTLVSEPAYSGKPIFYLDSGAVMVRWPREWLEKVRSSGMCVLEDPTQMNNQWCHETFCKKLSVTKEELDANQLWAGAMAFVGGHPLAVNVLEEAWVWGRQKDVIEGPKWSGRRPDGNDFGHRHDQSILSVLRLRYKVPSHPLYSVHSHISLRHTFMSGASIYCHRGLFKIHEPVTPGIDDAWVINLDRRADRLEKFKKGHPDLAERVLRLPAFEGTKLKLTPKVARLFAPHDFNWKKPVMGCALSHLALWVQLANEKPEVNSYLILEDDARLAPNWREAWDEAEQQKALPDGWDVMYLGGILPPNREGFEAECVEHVNEHVARVRENGVFGQNPPNRYFHFCAYAYVLTRRGAQKILDILRHKNGYWTSADHMICNIQQFLNIYFLHPLVAGCYQDDDPVYQKSVFNDFSRVDTFDSDLWNNKERFSEEEVKGVLDVEQPLDIMGALQDARDAMVSPPATVGEVVIGKESPSESKLALVSSQKNLAGLDKVARLGKRRIVSLESQDSSKWYEFAWLRHILWESNGVSMEVEQVSLSDAPPTDEPIVFVQRPVEATRNLLAKWNALGAKFYVLHLSDEFGSDQIDFYEWPSCLGVVRNYVRGDVAESEKVAVIPLGYHWAIPNGEPAKHTPRPPFRELVWSFVGTGWQGRQEKLAPLQGIPGEKKCMFMDDWNSPKMIGREECLSLMLNSWCVPCPGGQNPETFRFYEALEAGSVPILVKEEGVDPYFQMLAKWLPLLVANDWAHAAGLIHTLRERPEVYEQYRGQLLGAWEKMKADTKARVKSVFRV